MAIKPIVTVATIRATGWITSAAMAFLNALNRVTTVIPRTMAMAVVPRVPEREAAVTVSFNRFSKFVTMATPMLAAVVMPIVLQPEPGQLAATVSIVLKLSSAMMAVPIAAVIATLIVPEPV